MEFQYLKYFSALAETLNFSEAARKCHVSQPSLSAQIRLLEERLGTQLFFRDKRRVALTNEGKALIPRVRRILLDIDELSSTARSLQDPLSGALHIGATPLVALSSGVDKLHAIGEKHPHLKLTFSEDHSTGLIGSLLSGNLDLIFLPFHPDLESSRIDFVKFENMKMVVCYPKDERPELPFINVKPGCGLREFMTSNAKALRKDSTSSLQATHVEMIKKWVHLGLGWSLLPELSIRDAEKKYFQISRPKTLKTLDFYAAMLKGQRAEKILPLFIR